MASRGLLGAMSGLGKGVQAGAQTYFEAAKFEYMQQLEAQKEQNREAREDAKLAEARDLRATERAEDADIRKVEREEDRVAAESLVEKRAALTNGGRTYLDPKTDARIKSLQRLMGDLAKTGLTDDASAGKYAQYESELNSLTSDGEFTPPSSGYTEDQLGAADQYASNRVSEQAGLLSRDKTDFKDYGGDRNKAKEAYRQQYLSELSGKPYQGGTNNPAPQQETSKDAEILKSYPNARKAADGKYYIQKDGKYYVVD